MRGPNGTAHEKRRAPFVATQSLTLKGMQSGECVFTRREKKHSLLCCDYVIVLQNNNTIGFQLSQFSICPEMPLLFCRKCTFYLLLHRFAQHPPKVFLSHREAYGKPLGDLLLSSCGCGRFVNRPYGITGEPGIAPGRYEG